MSTFEEIAPATYVIPQEGGMRVPGLIIATPQLLEQMDIEKPLEQVRNVAHLPGIVGYSIAMPDIHWGYGFPIGGVAAMDAEDGVISPGGVGYDINCGVRLALVPPFKSLDARHKKMLINQIFSSGSLRRRPRPPASRAYQTATTTTSCAAAHGGRSIKVRF